MGGSSGASVGGKGGASSSGGTPSTGGASGGKAGSGGSGGATQPPATSCPNPTNGGVLNETMVVGKNETYDGQCRRFTAGSGLGDGSQDEDQKPMFRLEDGAKLINVVLGGPAADGIHTYGDVTLENITWQDIGEDALTIKESGTVVLNGGSATNGDDKVFQVNAASTFRISNFEASNAGKFIRQNGDTTFKVEVVIDRCDISDMDEAIFRTDSSSSTVTMTNTRYSNIGDALFIGVAAGNITQSNNTEY
jgi:pectate lyase C